MNSRHTKPLAPLLDNVHRRTLADYDEDRSHVTKQLLQCGARRVFEIGSVGALGISDLDLLACFPDDFDWSDLPPTAAGLLRELPNSFLHPPWVIRERHLEHLSALFAVMQMRDLATGAVFQSEQSPEERMLWSVEACALTLATLATRQMSTSTRSALCLVHGVTHNLSLAESDGIQPPGGQEFCRRIQALRSTWFFRVDPERTAELVDLWALGVGLLTEILSSYGTRLESVLGVRSQTEFDLPVPGSRLVYRFTNESSPARVLRSGLLVKILALPASIGPVFALLSRPGWGLESWLRPSFDWSSCGRWAQLDPAFESAAERYVRANAAYLKDVLSCRVPFLVLNGGTLAHVRNVDRSWVKNLASRITTSLAGR
jgi:hypothetical protein